MSDVKILKMPVRFYYCPPQARHFWGFAWFGCLFGLFSCQIAPGAEIIMPVQHWHRRVASLIGHRSSLLIIP